MVRLSNVEVRAASRLPNNRIPERCEADVWGTLSSRELAANQGNIHFCDARFSVTVLADDPTFPQPVFDVLPHLEGLNADADDTMDSAQLKIVEVGAVLDGDRARRILRVTTVWRMLRANRPLVTWHCDQVKFCVPVFKLLVLTVAACC